jgi:hypothetical protein
MIVEPYEKAETKVLMVAMSVIMRKSGSLEEAYAALEEMANADGLKLPPLTPNDDKK